MAFSVSARREYDRLPGISSRSGVRPTMRAPKDINISTPPTPAMASESGEKEWEAIFSSRDSSSRVILYRFEGLKIGIKGIPKPAKPKKKEKIFNSFSGPEKYVVIYKRREAAENAKCEVTKKLSSHKIFSHFWTFLNKPMLYYRNRWWRRRIQKEALPEESW